MEGRGGKERDEKRKQEGRGGEEREGKGRGG